jgi:hypothetical protein
VPVYALEYRPSLQDIPELTRAIMEVAEGTHLGPDRSPKMSSEVMLS